MPQAATADARGAPAPVSRTQALALVDREAAEQATAGLLALVRAGEHDKLAAAVRQLQAGSGPGYAGLAGPQREMILWKLATGLGDLPAGSVSPQLIDSLAGYSSRTLVPDDDHPGSAVPLFNVSVAALGSKNRWARQSAYQTSQRGLSKDPDRWLAAYLEANPAGRRGFVDSINDLPRESVEALARRLSSGNLGNEQLARAAARSAVRLKHLELARELLLRGHPGAIPDLFRGLSRALPGTQLTELLAWAAENAPPEISALTLAIAADERSGPGKSRHTASAAPQAENARLVEWVEDAPASDDSSIALGYPVPTPVNTREPFAGFRSYEGLNSRHQELANGTAWVHPHVVGTTHQGRSIMAYQLGDSNRTTRFGHPEPAMLSNGGIHAREWQSPEVTTGIIELLALADDDHLVRYLRDNANILVIPVLNIDGFLQTQRYPSLNWMGTDPEDPEFAPRDGRMRRKNMRGADTLLETVGDHLQGIDLNRNNSPYWATSNRSSSNAESLVHHGSHAASEPETQALDAAAQLGPINKLSMYTDLHSFSQVHFWVRGSNQRLTTQTQLLLGTFSFFHSAFPAGKWYGYNAGGAVALNQGIGSTDEYFTHTYQVPAWTLEIEPGSSGVDYGGLGRNGHDGFILPESEVPRVRTELAETFAVAYYRQAGPPSLSEFRIYDDATGAMVFQAAWDPAGEHQRSLFRHQVQALQAERDYTLWMAWDKPMRWRTDGEVTALPGTSNSLDLNITLSAETGSVTMQQGSPEWLMEPAAAPLGYSRYRDDAVSVPLRLSFEEASSIQLGVRTRDMTGHLSDARPATVARWENGGWAGYENDDGLDGNDSGGTDRTFSFQAAPTNTGDPFVVEPGLSSAWYDPERNGEGFIMEIISPDTAVMYWFTYDSQGRQNWYTSTGEIHGNRALFTDLISTRGGQFGPEFDPALVERKVAGRASFTWSSCHEGVMDWTIDHDGEPFQAGRMSLVRITRLLGAGCTQSQANNLEGQQFSGSWYDPDHDGEGYTLQMLDNGQALVYWFSYDTTGNPRWFFGLGEVEDGTAKFAEMFTTHGALFGDGFDPDDLVVQPWGSLELQLGCNAGSAVFAPTEPGFPAGSLELVQLTHLDGLGCNP